MAKALLYVLRMWIGLALLAGPAVAFMLCAIEFSFSGPFTFLGLLLSATGGIALVLWFVEEYC